MGQTDIAWTSYRTPTGELVPGFSFNPWHGCVKVSPGCDRCYAETQTKWLSKTRLWGQGTPRQFPHEPYWAGPPRWDRKAEAEGTRPKVFCASMGDVFERHPDPQVAAHRARLFALIVATPHLDWLLLTKRIGNVAGMVPPLWLRGSWPLNAWLGTSVENQTWANVRLPVLVNLPAPVHFVSMEPLLGYVHLRTALLARGRGYLAPDVQHRLVHLGIGGVLEWVITGGESGNGHRPAEASWFRGLQQQCANARKPIPFFFKQWGGRTHAEGGDTLDGQSYQAFPLAPASMGCFGCHQEVAGWRDTRHHAFCQAHEW